MPLKISFHRDLCVMLGPNLFMSMAIFKGVVNCQNSRDKGPPEGNSARG